MKFCVIGVGRFGYSVATTLADRGMEVLAVDSDEHSLLAIQDRVSQAVCMEVHDEESLRSLGIEDMDAVIVGIGEDFAQSILITALLKQNLKFPRVIVRSVTAIQRDILLLIGADQVIMPEQEIGSRLADNLSLHFESIAILTPKFSIAQVTAPKKFVGKKISTIHEQYHVLCVGRQREGAMQPIEFGYTIQENDHLLFSGENSDLEKISKL